MPARPSAPSPLYNQQPPKPVDRLTSAPCNCRALGLDKYLHRLCVAVYVLPHRTAHRIPCSSSSSSISAPRRRRTMLPADMGAKHVLVLARFRAKRARQTRTCNHTNNHTQKPTPAASPSATTKWPLGSTGRKSSAKGDGLFRSVSLRPSRSGLNASGGPRFRPLTLCRCAIILGCE